MAIRFIRQSAFILLFSTITSGSSRTHHEASVSSSHSFLSAVSTHSAAVPLSQTIALANAELKNFPRKLQDFTPEDVCAEFAKIKEFNQTFSCECSQYGVDVQVDCDYRDEQCNSDGSVCYLGSIQRILELDANSDEGTNSTATVARVVTTCTRFTTDDDDSETCIRIFPITSGNFSTIKSCSVQYTPTAGDDFMVCSDCSPCETGQNDLATISFSCCDVETDLKQTCGPTQDGVAVPVFDIIPESEKGMCTSAGPAGTFSLVGAISFATMLFWIQK